MKAREQIPKLVKELYAVANKLGTLYPERCFTPDGVLVGSIGEVIAAHDYNLTLLPSSTKTHDAKTKDGKLVQIKITQRNRVALNDRPDHLIVLKLFETGKTKEVYNGPGKTPWNKAGKLQKNGQRPIPLSRLSDLMKSVSKEDRICLVKNST